MTKSKDSVIKIKKSTAFGWMENCEDIISLSFSPRDEIEFIIKTPHPKNKLYLVKIDAKAGTATMEPYKKTK